MVSAYKPKQRHVAVRILSKMGWISAQLHLAERASLTDYLSSAPQFLTLTDVHFETGLGKLSCFSLQRHAILFVIPEVIDDLVESSTNIAMTSDVFRKILLVFERGAIKGTTETVPNTRVSDFFERREGFFTVHDAYVRLWTQHWLGDEPSPVREHRFPAVIVNSEQLIGAGESLEDVQPSPKHPIPVAIEEIPPELRRRPKGTVADTE